MLLGALGEVPDSTFGNSILEMGVDPTIGELLAAQLTCLLKRIVCKTAIVAMVVLDCNAAYCLNASFAHVVSSADKSCIRCMYCR